MLQTNTLHHLSYFRSRKPNFSFSDNSQIFEAYGFAKLDEMIWGRRPIGDSDEQR
ncbi:hypothetical protein Scep_011112 [Stephania cephalantha]|uniref:Uncharacterized protein n=1 Tax=Stephania cephalantha TaxID=152367 RepID=A0AAP0JCR4_9MAGN